MALLVGLDVGSTTTKVYAMHEDMTEAWWGYRRHGACQTASVRAMLGELAEHGAHARCLTRPVAAISPPRLGHILVHRVNFGRRRPYVQSY